MNCPHCKIPVTITDKRRRQHACKCGAYNRIIGGQLVFVKMRPVWRSSPPRKGGRTEDGINFRMTPAEKGALKQLLTERKISFADWVAECIKNPPTPRGDE